VKSAISIANYEEFFLLYIDNELSAAERKAVEEFVGAHPDLAVELEMLQQVQLMNEPLLFDDRKILYRKESEEISHANCEEQFLLFVDNELSPEAKEKVETFVLQHPAVQEGFTLLKQTKLEAETIVFTDKKSLYRKEEKERPVFYLNWQRIAVAAAFIGLAVLVWSILPGEKQPQINIAKLDNKNVPGTVTNNKGVDPSKNNGSNSGVEQARVNRNNNGVEQAGNVIASASTLQTTNQNVTVQQGNVAVNPSNTNNNAVIGGEQNVVTANTVIASIKPPAVDVKESEKGETVSTDNHNSFQTVVASTQKVTAGHSALENNAITASNTDAVTGGPNNNDVQPAVYRELDTEDEKKSLLLGSLEINKDKLRGFFRKAGNIFRSKSKTEDEKTESRPSTSTRSLR
jgi:hypothetical protein